MKKTLLSKIMLSALAIMFTLTLVPTYSLASSENTQMIKKDETNYMIYIEETMNQDFEFAFSNNANSEKESLQFEQAARDSQDGNYIAYVASELYTQYFDGKDSTYLWVRQDENTYLLEAEEIKLTDALEETEIQDLNNVTKKITVEVGEKTLPSETVDGVTITRKVGVLKVTDSSKDYSYQMSEVKEGTDSARLVELANEMNKLDDKNIYEKLAIYSEFEELYTKLQPQVNEEYWIEVENNEINQPDDSKQGDKYLVWIKAEENGTATTDLQIMTCANSYTQEYETQEVVITETTRLPITGENIALFIVAGVIVLLIILVFVLKFKNKKDKAQ